MKQKNVDRLRELEWFEEEYNRHEQGGLIEIDQPIKDATNIVNLDMNRITKLKDIDTNSHSYRMTHDPEYNAMWTKRSIETTARYGGIDYPKEDIRSKNYTGNPNSMFSTGKTGRIASEVENFNNELIGAFLPIPELVSLNKIKKLITSGSKQIYTPSTNAYYRVVNETAARDFLENQIVRSSPTGDNSLANMVGKININGRPTAWPSFAKGTPDLTYSYGDASHYVIETTRPMKTSTVARHGRGSTRFPVDKDGKYITEFPTSQAKLFKSNNEGGYDFVPTKGNGGMLDNLKSKDKQRMQELIDFEQMYERVNKIWH